MPADLVLQHWSTAARRDLTRLAVVDRDGVLVDSAASPTTVTLHRGAHGALRTLRDNGFTVVVLSNQGAVSRGELTMAEMLRINEAALTLLDPGREVVDHVLVCPHAAADGCRCRKPRTGAVEALARRLGSAPRSGWFFGDQLTDLLCGRALGLRTALVGTGYGGRTWAYARHRHLADVQAASFAAAVRRVAD